MSAALRFHALLSMSMKKNQILALLASALLSCAAHAGSNWIGDGDFEALDYAGFGSDYIKNGNLYDPAVLAIGSNPHAFHSGWASFGAYSGSEMLIVNGGTHSGASAGKNAFWSQDLSLNAGSYDFSAFATSTYGGNPSKLQAVLTQDGAGTVLATLQLGSTAGQWQQMSGSFSLATGAKVTLTLLDLSNDYGGNDFAVDHLSLTAVPVPEPETYALLLAGLVAIALSVTLRRRR